MKIVLCVIIPAYFACANSNGDQTTSNNDSLGNCVENVSSQTNPGLEYAAKLLLLYNAKDIGEILKRNPSDRNVRLMKVLRRVLNERLGYVFPEEKSINEEISGRFNSTEEYHEGLKDDTKSSGDIVEAQVNHRLRLNPSEIVQIVRSYIATSESATIIGSGRIRDKKWRSFQSADCFIGSGDDGKPDFGEKEGGDTGKDTRESSSLGFPEVPDGDDLRIGSLKLDEEDGMFQVFSVLASYLQPKEFPLGLLRDAFKQHLSSHIVVLQILKLEGLTLCWILFWAILSVCSVGAASARVCCPRGDVHRLGVGDTSSAYSSNLNNKCSDGMVGIVLYILMSSLLSSILLTLIANDKFSRAIERSPTTAVVIFKDVETFISNTQLQISFVATSSFEITTDRVNKDLQDAENLLGNPFLEDLTAETKLDQTVSDLINLKSESRQISNRIRELLRECELAKDAGKLLRKRLSEVVKQVNLARKHCVHLDRSLCETIQANGLDLTFSVDELLVDPNLRYLESIGSDNKLNDSVVEALELLRDIPGYVGKETLSQRTAILEVLQERARRIQDCVRSLQDISKSMTTSVKSSAETVLSLVGVIAEKDLWRYLAVVATSSLMFFIWILFLCGSPCCCHHSQKTVPCLKFGICLMCFSIMILWLYGSIAFIIGGHGQSIACNPLYEDSFTILSNILDKNGLIHEEGFFTHFLEANSTLRTEEILSNCKENQPSYTTFHLENRLDIPNNFNYHTWDDLKPLLENFNFSIKDLKLYPENLKRELESLSSVASPDRFRDIDGGISSPIMRRDLKSFHDQLITTTKQLTNAKSTGTFQEITRKIEEIINDELKIVEEHRDAILYRLTAAEILLQPLSVKVEKCAIGLKESQDFLQGNILVQKTTRNYILRLKQYLDDLHQHVDEHLTKKIGGCKPLWDLFLHTREHICRSIIDPMNALSFIYFMGISIFVCLTPLIVKFINYYRDTDIADYVGRGPFGENATDQPIWVTPSSGTSSSSNDSRSIIVQEEIPSPNGDDNGRTTSVRVIPPTPPRQPPTPSAGRTTPRSTGSHTSAGTKFTRYDSLKVIERTWKTPRGTQSPRKWF